MLKNIDTFSFLYNSKEDRKKKNSVLFIYFFGKGNRNIKFTRSANGIQIQKIILIMLIRNSS